jgi:sRNA-binding regulator protein Hfq
MASMLKNTFVYSHAIFIYAPHTEVEFFSKRESAHASKQY